MNYILSKYTFAVSKRTSSGQEICLLFSGRTGKNILVSKKVFSIVENGKFTTLQPKVWLYRYCPWMRGMATSQISCNNGIDKKASHVPL